MNKFAIVPLLLGAVAASPALAAEQQVTSLSSPTPAGTHWAALPDENTGTVAITPAAPRSGTASLELTGDRTRAQTGIQYSPFTTNIGLLDEVLSLTYDWQVAAGSSRTDYTPALRLMVQDGSQRSELIWEGAYNPGASSGTLASQNAAGQWYSTSSSDRFWQYVAGVGPNEAGGTLQLHTIAEWATLYTNAAAYVSGISVGAGGGATGGYHAYVDNVTFTTTAGATTYNFEAPAVPEPATWAMMIAGMGVVGGAMRRRATTRAATA